MILMIIDHMENDQRDKLIKIIRRLLSDHPDHPHAKDDQRGKQKILDDDYHFIIMIIFMQRMIRGVKPGQM